jgi:hypothetical protein
MVTASKQQIFILEAGKRYAAPSVSAPGMAYEVVVHSEYHGDVSCNCRGYEFRRDCRHVRAILAQIQADREIDRARLEEQINDLYR